MFSPNQAISIDNRTENQKKPNNQTFLPFTFSLAATPEKHSNPFTFRGLHNASPGTPIPFPKPSKDAAPPFVELNVPGSPLESGSAVDDNKPNPSLEELTQGLSLNERQPYDPRDEELPEEGFFTREFQSTLAQSTKLAQEAGEILSKISEGSDNQDIRELKAKANELSRYESSKLTTIALLGTSGGGKSSLINSLLHHSELARTVS